MNTFRAQQQFDYVIEYASETSRTLKDNEVILVNVGHIYYDNVEVGQPIQLYMDDYDSNTYYNVEVVKKYKNNDIKVYIY